MDWTERNVTVMPGVHNGDGAIIAANSVVAKDVPPYCISGGNPCRVIRQRFDDELTSYLLNLKWWDWDADKKEYHPEDVTPFVNAHHVVCALESADGRSISKENYLQIGRILL